MLYKTVQPWRQLASYIDSIWIQEDHDEELPEVHEVTKLLPTANVDLAFSYGDRFAEVHNGREERLTDFHVTGQRSKPVRLRAMGRTGIIIVKFHPWGLQPFVKSPINEFTDTLCDIDLLISPNLVSEYKDRIYNTPDPNGKAFLIQHMLLGILDERKKDDLIIEAVKRINITQGAISIEQLSRELYISRRQLARRFLNVVGINAKKFSNIIRFQKALLYQKKGIPTMDIIHKLGYYDQAHMIREFNAFADFTPEFVASKVPNTGLMQHFNSYDNPSHFYNTSYM